MVERDDPMGTIVVIPPDNQRRPPRRRWRVLGHMRLVASRIGWLAGFPVVLFIMGAGMVASSVVFVLHSSVAASKILDGACDLLTNYIEAAPR